MVRIVFRNFGNFDGDYQLGYHLDRPSQYLQRNFP